MAMIYLDNNATTPMLPEVALAMAPFASENFANPASAHRSGRRARQALEEARERVAALLDASPEEVVFTSGATEANNLAVFGLVGETAGRIVTSPIEHPSVEAPIQHLGQHGFDIAQLAVNACGIVDVNSFAEPLHPTLRLVSVQRVNHETGAIQPVEKLVALLHDRVAFHCDAVQAAGKIPVHFHALGVTTLSLSAHKFHGPKGVGVLLTRKGARLQPRSWGGHQQHGKRPGTESVGLAVGLASALDLATRALGERQEQVRRLRKRFLERLQATVAPLILNGPSSEESGVPHTLNLSFPGCDAAALLMNLDLAEVACATGSACSSGSLLPSPVLRAMGVNEETLGSAIRFSLSAFITDDEIDGAALRIETVVRRLRTAEAASGREVTLDRAYH